MKSGRLGRTAIACILTVTATGCPRELSPMVDRLESLAASGVDALESERIGIRSLMVAFQRSIATHDIVAMRSLFWNETIVWTGAGHPDSVAYYESQGLDVASVEVGGAYQLLDDPKHAKTPLEERFGPATIDTDGKVAFVSFDYVFLEKGAATNWGREYWQLVKVKSEWKILHLLYSYHDVRVRPVPPAMKW